MLVGVSAVGEWAPLSAPIYTYIPFFIILCRSSQKYKRLGNTPLIPPTLVSFLIAYELRVEAGMPVASVDQTPLIRARM